MRVSWRAFSAGLGFSVALTACGGRAEVSDAQAASDCLRDCEPGQPDAGVGGAGAPLLGAGGEMLAAGSGGAGSAGSAENGGALSEGEGGLGGQAGDSGGGACARSEGPFATDVSSHSFGGGQSFNQAAGFPKALLGAPVANDTSSVVSLGNGGWVVLEFAGNAIIDGPGVDFTVFENPLLQFKELATVAVSDDLEHWTEFPCIAEQDASDFGFCAGVGVVHSSPSNGIDPLDPAVSGGDHYDLADIHVTHARFVRITDRADLSGATGVFDLDAVAIVHAECP